MKILVTGGSGFVGSQVVAEAAKRGHDVVSLSRGVQALPRGYRVAAVKVDLVRPHGLDEALQGVKAVVHAAGILRERGSQSFERAHVGATANLVDACKRAGVEKIIQVSALGAAVTAPTSYLRTKRQAERLVEESGIPFTIFRPSLIFGAGDRLVSHLVALVRYSPLVPVVAPERTRLQPVWVGDVVAAILGAVADPSTDATIYELGGPAQMTFVDLIEIVKKGLGRGAFNVRVPALLAHPFVRLGERFFDEPPLTVQELAVLSSGGTCDPSPAAVTFGLRMRSLADVLREYR